MISELFNFNKPKSQICIIPPIPININSEFNIEGLDVISIERRSSDEKTIISYREQNQTIEWEIESDNVIHQHYIDRFKEKLAKKRHDKIIMVCSPDDCVVKTNDGIICLNGVLENIKEEFNKKLNDAISKHEYTFSFNNVVFLTESFYNFNDKMMYSIDKLPSFFLFEEWFNLHKSI
ncbi:MAG: hypothetical protein PHC28_06745 [Flavobacterium sp.]|uniref:hypothetical protein n=1 Tax=Flavobacterium sp. TaxID=239 RepID=UPI00261FDB26|nr:hypothetical protein [Flavobacterium sp.]MDD5150168.1 hypothetical protein [Flavobacterium sp.]